MMQQSSSKEEEEKKNLKCLMNEATNADSKWSDRRASSLQFYNRVMKLSPSDLKKEAKTEKGEARPVLLMAAASFRFPFDAIDRLYDAVGLESTDPYGCTAIIFAAAYGAANMVDFLARNKRADLSIVNVIGDNVFDSVGSAPNIAREENEDVSCIERQWGEQY
jgi:hypothetical protein